MPTGRDPVVEVWVTPPRSVRPGVEVDGDLVRIRVAEAPVDGLATEAVRQALDGALGVLPASVVLARGRHSRTKRFPVGGLDSF